jgi:hypothetical protein
MKKLLLLAGFYFFMINHLFSQDTDSPPKYPGWRIRAAIAPTVVLGSTKAPSQGLERLAKDSQRGTAFNVEIGGFWNRNNGLNFVYSRYRSQDEGNYDGIRESDMRISYFGPSFMARNYAKDGKSCLVAQAGLGYAGFRQDIVTNASNSKLTGSTLGLFTGLAGDVFFTKSIGLSIGVNLIVGALGSVTQDTGFSTTKLDLGDNPQALSQLQFSAGLRF